MNKEIKNSAKANGLIIGTLLSIKFLLSASDNYFLLAIASILSFTIIVIIYGFAIKFRDTQNGGKFEFGEAYGYIFQTYFYGTILSSLVILIYCQFFDQLFLQNQITLSLANYEKMNIQIDNEAKTVLISLFKPAFYSFGNIIAGAIIGAFWALILAYFAKKVNI